MQVTVHAALEAMDDNTWERKFGMAAELVSEIGASHRGNLEAIRGIPTGGQRGRLLQQHALVALLKRVIPVKVAPTKSPAQDNVSHCLYVMLAGNTLGSTTVYSGMITTGVTLLLCRANKMQSQQPAGVVQWQRLMSQRYAMHTLLACLCNRNLASKIMSCVLHHP
jgi:hypothetical protein